MKSRFERLRGQRLALVVVQFCAVSTPGVFAEGGTVIAWGDNASGWADVPLTATNVTAVAAGVSHSMALNQDGTVLAWGLNECGTTDVPLDVSNVVAIAAGGWDASSLRNDGLVFNWGCNNFAPGFTEVIAIAAGWDHTLALRSDHTVFGWGYNGGGQTSVPAGLTNVVAIAAGALHNMSILNDGTVFVWGDNSAGQTNVPAGLSNVAAIAAGSSHCLALKSDGSVVAWGDNSTGQTNVPSGLNDVMAIDAGYAHNLALRSNGTVVAWGENGSGQTNVPAGLSNVVAIAAGLSHSLAVRKNEGPPFIGQQPFNQTLFHGETGFFKSIVAGSAPLQYQWRFNGTNLSGATNASLTLADTRLTNAGDYSVMVSNALGTVISSNAALAVVIAPPTITPQSPGDQLVLLGSNVTLSVTATGPVPMTYQWQLNGTNLLGTTNNSLSLTNFQVADEGNYTVVVSNDFFSASSANMHLTAGDLPGALNARYLDWATSYLGPWSWQGGLTHDGVAAAHSGPVITGRRSSIYTTVVGPGTLSFWMGIWSHPFDNLVFLVNGVQQSYVYDSDPYGNPVWGYFSIYLPDGPQDLEWAFLRNATQNQGSRAGYLDQVSYVAGPTLPIFTTVPTDQTVLATGTATFTVAATGTPPLSYQWQLNGTDLAGATNTSLSLSGVQATNAGNYNAVVSNPYGTTNATAMLTVTPVPPRIVTQPASRRVPVNGSTTFAVNVTGSVPFNFQWSFNGTNLDGATNSSLTLTNLQTVNSGTYQVAVNNGFGAVNSSNAGLTVAWLLAWGNNFYSQTSIPQTLINAVGIAAGWRHSLALNFDHTVTAWGDNTYGQTNIPSNLSNVISITAGSFHNLALTTDGNVVAWGAGTNIAASPHFGQSAIPPGLGELMTVAGGGYHSLVLKSNGTVTAWGNNANGQTNVPLNLSNVVAIAGGGYHSLALRSDGTVVAWGAGTNTGTAAAPNYGQSRIPSGLSNVVAVAAGFYHSLVLRSNGTVAAWGQSSFGQTFVPAGLSNVVAIACGGYHNLALKSDGKLVAWGLSSDGQISLPVGLSNVVAIAGGTYHSLALINDGSPFVLRQPSNQTATLGTSNILGVVATGPGVLHYQWQLNGRDVGGATNASLVLGNLHWTNSGSYHVVISNASGFTVGSPVILTVLRTPLRFDSASLTPPTQMNVFGARLLGASGTGPIVIYACSNMVDWLPIYTNPPVIGSIDFTDPASSSTSERLYRAAELFVPSPIQFETSVLSRDRTDGTIRLQITGLSAAGPVTVYASSNLVDWSAIFTNPPTIGPLEYFDSSGATQSLRFYRASELR